MYILLFCAFFFFKGQKRDGYKKSEGIPEKPKADLTKKVNKKCKPDKKCEAFFVSKKIFFCQTWFDPEDRTIVRSSGSNHGQEVKATTTGLLFLSGQPFF